MKIALLALLAIIGATRLMAEPTSVAGFFSISNQGRQVFNFNPGWLFALGEKPGAEAANFDDSHWEVVSLPHCVKLEPAEASGCRNYQGVAWYRKHFTVPADGSTVYFEAIMGKQRVYVNGRLATEHLGGYLPIVVDLGKQGLRKGDKAVIAVMADNSDDKTYPPGKTQFTLDFAYHGGIYRDAWIIARQPVHITDPIEANRQGGGGVFVHTDGISEQSARVMANTDVANTSAKARTVRVEQLLKDRDGRVVATAKQSLRLLPGDTLTSRLTLKVRRPHLWSPESPCLYNLETRVTEGGKTVDGGMTRVGIRSIEFRGHDGFWLNGHRYRQFVGANRHQDFAYVGNALPNSQQWRDAKRLKDAGFNIIRTAHYPQDPSFMDACDELGLFIIVATPGWQFWNKKPEFAQRVQQNTREIIRRDRNHASVIGWEPILNETPFPLDFSLNALQITKEEYPYPNAPVAAADVASKGVKDNYGLVYGWPGDDEKADRPKQPIMTREFGEYVDSWYAHNNLNRASRSWGERPMLVQALSLAGTTHEMFRTTGQFIGGCLWHPFDHQRGYHPDPYWGGIYDAFRQKKTAFYMFASQRQPSAATEAAPAVEPMVHIAHEMTQFSDSDVVVFSNCDSVRLTMYDSAKVITLPVSHCSTYTGHTAMPFDPTDHDSTTPNIIASTPQNRYNYPVVFKGVWNFWQARERSYKQRAWQKVKMKAEGIIGGKVVCSELKMPSRRSTKLRLVADEMGKRLVADGSDFVVVVCEVTDDEGNVRRLAKENISFTVSGDGEIIGDGRGINANPRAVEWGSAPILVRSTRHAGPIHIHAEVQFPGTLAPTPADLTIESVPYDGEMVEGEGISRVTTVRSREAATHTGKAMTQEEKQRALTEVEQQQTDFGINK